MLTMSTRSRTCSRRSSSTALWIFFILKPYFWIRHLIWLTTLISPVRRTGIPASFKYFLLQSILNHTGRAHHNYKNTDPRSRIIFVRSDEAHFWLNGYVNKQNCRIWSEANPRVYVETPLHPEKLTVWCALWAGGILLQKR
ncbi:uncharacterized protein TNCV_1663591 [Trichonephila clavipes]|nr:uncharacterized protein TNCV_1663591 [Trichonephila clavipes]